MLKGILSAVCLTLLAVLLCAQPTGTATVVTLADFTGDAAVHAITVATTTARWILFVAPTTNSGTVRVGDSAITATRGVPIAAGAGLMMPPIPPAPAMKVQDQYYKLSTFYYLAGSGDKLSVVYGR